MSDFHEMATHLRMQEERSLLMENHTFMVKTNGHSGAGCLQFSYSDHLAEKTAEIDLIIFSGKKHKENPET